MVIVSFGLWFIVVFGIRIAVFGNPLYRLVAEADASFLAGVDAIVMGETQEAGELEIDFIRRFTRGTLLQLVMLFSELVLMVHLWWVQVLPLLSGALVIKDFLVTLIGIWAARRQRRQGVLTVVLSVPRWMIGAERVSAAASAVGALLLFLTVNKLRPW